MSYKKNDIITVITMAGEFIGKYVKEDATSLTIAKPKMLVNGEQGMGFGSGVCVTGEIDPSSMTFYVGGIVFTSMTSVSIGKSYIEATSGLIL